MKASVKLRFASPSDLHALEHLAQLDSTRPPRMPALVAEVDGELVAALPLLGDSEVVADPFRATADLARMLELRAARLSGRIRRPRPRLRGRIERPRTLSQPDGFGGPERVAQESSG
jgi:hypothetical protein